MPIFEVMTEAGPTIRQWGTFHMDDLSIWKQMWDYPSKPVIFGHFININGICGIDTF